MFKIIDKDVNPENRGEQWLVKRDGKFFVVSYISNEFGEETLIFPADSEGNITDWLEVFGMRYARHEEVIKEWLED